MGSGDGRAGDKLWWTVRRRDIDRLFAGRQACAIGRLGQNPQIVGRIDGSRVAQFCAANQGSRKSGLFARRNARTVGGRFRWTDEALGYQDRKSVALVLSYGAALVSSVRTGRATRGGGWQGRQSIALVCVFRTAGPRLCRSERRGYLDCILP